MPGRSTKSATERGIYAASAYEYGDARMKRRSLEDRTLKRHKCRAPSRSSCNFVSSPDRRASFALIGVNSRLKSGLSIITGLSADCPPAQPSQDEAAA